MINFDENTITQAVLERHADCPDPRLRTIMTSLIKHLHAFARDVQLTEEEWATGIAFLTEAGRITDDKRQEFILLSDTLGLSMLVIAMTLTALPFRGVATRPGCQAPPANCVTCWAASPSGSFQNVSRSVIAALADWPGIDTDSSRVGAK